MMDKSLQSWQLLVALAVASGQIVGVLLGEELALAQQPPSQEAIAQVEPTSERDAPLLSEMDRPATTLDEWVAQGSDAIAEPIRIIEIQLNVTEAGVEIVLTPESGTLPLPATEIAGNALIAKLANTVLALPDEDEFVAFEPAEGIALVQVVAVAEQTVQLSITGTEAPPVVEVSTEAQTLVLNVAPGNPATATEDDDSLRVLVTGAEESRYVEPTATTGTRTDTPIRDIPQSIQVIPQEVIEDQQAIRLNDALRNVSGVVNAENDPRGQRFIVRGFDSASVLRDGFRLAFGSTGNIGFPELANIQQIEVLKGPAAVLFGALEPGGVINLVSEQPTSEPFYEFSFQPGNRDLISPGIDIAGPLTGDGRLSYRLNMLYRSEESFRDFNTDIERFFVAPVVSWQISDRTDLILNFEYSDDERPADFGLVAIGDEVADIPFDRPLGELDDISTSEFLRAGYQFEHHFSDNWKVRNAFFFTEYDTEFISANPNFGRVDEATGTLFRTFILLDQPSDTFELQTNVVGEFSTGFIDHNILVGIDLFRRDAFENVGRGDFRSPVPINIFDPVFGATPRPDFDEQPIFFDADTRVDALSVYLQDLIAFRDNLKLLVGLRFEAFEQTIENFPSFFNPAASETTQSGDALTPRVGLVYQPIEEVSLFASFSRSFSPNFVTTVSGDLLEPEQGEQFELGARAELLGGRFVANLALFHLTLENIAAPDPDFPTFSVATGEQRSQGIELDLIGELLPGWNLILNYAFTDAEITEDDSGIEGNRRFSVPRNNFNLWTTYEIQRGSLQGLGFGLGFNFVSDRFGDNANSFTLDSYFLTNAAIFYRRNNWRANLNFRNLFDIDYIESAGGSRTSEIYPGEDFTVIGSVSIEF